MKYRYQFISVIIAMLFLAGCNNTKNDTAVLTPDELCVQVKELISQHGDGFKQLKGNLQVTKNMDIWDAKYHLVGKGCQIWRWSNGKQAYMCSLTVPDKSLAIEKQNKAIDFSRQCLGNEWSAEKVDRNNGRAVGTVFSKEKGNTVASIHRIKIKGLFKSEWTVYYFIGNRDQSL